MADLFDVAEIIGKMADGFEAAVLKALSESTVEAETAIRDQLYSGLSGDDSELSPNYDNDPYFDDPTSSWYQRGEDYKGWKYSITPPRKGWMLDTPPRPVNVPNLYIDGKFYSTIYAEMNGDSLTIEVAADPTSLDIVEKWGDNILKLGSYAIDYFSYAILTPRIWKFFEECGW